MTHSCQQTDDSVLGDFLCLRTKGCLSSSASSHDVDIVQEVLSSSEQLALSLKVGVKSTALNRRTWAFKVALFYTLVVLVV